MKGYKFRNNIKRDIKDTLVKNLLYVSCKNDFNDPIDAKIDDRKVISFLEENKKYSHDVEKKYKALLNDIENEHGIFCLSKDVKNDLLWAYYSDGHNGFCIEYDIDTINSCYNYGVSEESRELPLCLINVIYNNDMPIFNHGDIKDTNKCIKFLIGQKSQYWEIENEIRLIFNTTGFVEFDYRAVTGIYFGVKHSKKDKSMIMKRLKGRNIKYYQMKYIPYSYELTYCEIQDEYSDSSKYIANNLPYDNIKYLSVYSENEKYKDQIKKALEVVSKEPCINKIDSCFVNSINSTISITTKVNDDFIIFPKKVFIFDVVDREVTLKEFYKEPIL